MNGLSLRISRAGTNKSKNTTTFIPVSIIDFNSNENDRYKIIFETFIHASSSDEQLILLKNMFDDLNGTPDLELIHFLVTVYLQADTKHPVKCFITRQISKRHQLLEPFAQLLAQELDSLASQSHKDYKNYVVTVNKIATCIENFPAGSLALKKLEITLANYLKDCLSCCVEILRETTLPPTEKNEIFNLAHIVLRLLLYIIQKLEESNICRLNCLLNVVKEHMLNLMFYDDVPMDTKSVCGILYLTVYVMENGPDSWLDTLHPGESKLDFLMRNEASQLAIYSAIPTVVPDDAFISKNIGNKRAITLLTQSILQFGERSSSESVFTLGVTRTLLQISKALDGIKDCILGAELMELLLDFIWAHLEHYMDSVRHLAAQMLSCIVKYCTRLKKSGDYTGLNRLFLALKSLDRARKSFYLSLCALSHELGASALMEQLPGLICEVLKALNIQAVQASATTALETLLQRHIEESPSNVIHAAWIEPIVRCVTQSDMDSAVLSILENLLAKAVKKDDNIITFVIHHLKQSLDFNEAHDLMCALMLLSVLSKSGATSKLSTQENDAEWKGIISYKVLQKAAVDALDETRILSLSLIVESPRTTEPFASGDLTFVLWYLKYNINAQSPNFRQHTLSLLKKFIKRFNESYKALKRQNLPHCEIYLRFFENLRRLCFDSLVQGANYSRRYVALQLLVWCETIRFDDYERNWTEDYIEKLLLHLEDSYENNKQFSLKILEACPPEMIKIDKYSISLNLDDVLCQASSLKPTECVSAAYKLDLIRKKLPERVTKGAVCEVVDSVTYKLLEELVARLREQVSHCRSSVVIAARDAPMYGVLHCIEHLLNHIDPEAIREDLLWSQLISQLIDICIEVNASVACVVNNSSPEGHLPMDMSGVQITDHGNSGGIKLDDGRPVTAQMVLLCAWRSVKEAVTAPQAFRFVILTLINHTLPLYILTYYYTDYGRLPPERPGHSIEVSLLLGTISSRLTIMSEGEGSGTLTARQMCIMGEHFTKLLAETKHRGAFEQAYVGFTRLLTRLWRCRSPELHELPRGWLSQLIATISSGENGTLCATRRSAGLPFMIQALVTSEVQARGNGKSLEECVRALITLCSARDAAADGAERRAHCLNVLRALYRHSALQQYVAPHVGEGLRLALQGFDSHTWMERNSSTLLFSALMVRIFGVQRSRDADQLCVRNRMTGRIFFLRYPQLYDYMLEKLKEVSRIEDTKLLRPSLYPILLLLARLYPSSLEGTVSNLKLVAFVPHVLSCAKSSVMKTRELAAKAMVPLISPDQYLPHLEAMLTILQDRGIKRNYCHGILMQLSRLLDAKPELRVEETVRERLAKALNQSLWILDEETVVTCWLLTDEYIKMMNFVLWKFPTILDKDCVTFLQRSLSKLIFQSKPTEITSGRDVCLSNALYLYFIILHKFDKEAIWDLVEQALTHTSYEVVLTVLNYLLILYKKIDVENRFQQHLHSITTDNSSLLQLTNRSNYIQLICKVLASQYLECKQKSLRILVLESNTQMYIIEDAASNEDIVEKLSEKIYKEHENLTHVYLDSLSMFISERLAELSPHVVLSAMRVIFDSCTADSNEFTRAVVVAFLERNILKLFDLKLDHFNKEDRFEYKATLYATIVTVLEDDSDALRQRTADMLLASERALPARVAETLRTRIQQCEDGAALLVMLALLDFKSEVCLTDDVSDECRVFDQNERYNVFLEETFWTLECSDSIIRNYKGEESVIDFVMSIIEHPQYKRTLKKLCNNNIVIFKNMVEGDADKLHSSDVINPKIKMFLNKLID